MHEARVAPELPCREPVALFGPRSALLLTAGLLLVGCSTPGGGLLRPVSLAPPDAAPLIGPLMGEERAREATEAGNEADLADPAVARRWVLLSRLGREAMRPGHYQQAERHFLSALDALDSQSPGDARLRATLGNLVRLAAIYERLERDPDAQRVLSAISDHAETRGASRLRGGIPYDSRYRDLVGQSLPRALGAAPVGSASSRSTSSKKKLDALIKRTARSYSVDPALVKAVVAAESNFEPRAVSKAGAQGLMQLMPETAEAMGVLAPFRPSDNIRGGVRYLRKMLDRYGDLSEALAAYNAGPNAVDRYGGIPPYAETREYVKRVLNFYRGYQDQFTR